MDKPIRVTDLKRPDDHLRGTLCLRISAPTLRQLVEIATKRRTAPSTLAREFLLAQLDEVEAAERSN